jgi:membrane-associated protease RseP (regulator of RpoE activity)
MQSQQNFNVSGSGDQFCAQCGSPMPKEMRFCRSCGNRLGEGPPEYTETARFPGTTARTKGGFTTPFYPTFNAPMTTASPASCARRRRLGFTGTAWLWIVLVAFFGIGGVMSWARKGGNIPRGGITFSADRSYVGVDRLKTTDGGVTFNDVDTPGGPADRAGLVGGDVVTSFDGHSMREANEVTDLLEHTPIGKTVEVVYLRDGISHTTQLTTISRRDLDRLQADYSRRSEGKGKFGFEPNDVIRVTIPETKTFGVRINSVTPNGPADLFGIQQGDIITDFGEVPIRTPEEFLARVRRTLPHTKVNVTLLRAGQKMVIPVTLGKY